MIWAMVVPERRRSVASRSTGLPRQNSHSSPPARAISDVQMLTRKPRTVLA